MSIKLQLPEQEFESPQDYIRDKLVPVCQELEGLVEDLFSPKVEQVKLKASVCNDEGFGYIDKPINCVRQWLDLDLSDYPKFKGERRRKVMLTISGYSTGGVAKARVERISHKEFRFNKQMSFSQYVTVDESDVRFYIQGNDCFVLTDWSLDVIYVD